MATLLKSVLLFTLGLLLVVSTNLPGLSKAITSSGSHVCPIASMNETPAQTRAQALDAEGHRKFMQGQPYEALTCWQAADQLYQQPRDAEALAINHLNQAQALQALGYYLQAEKLLKEKLLPKLKESPYNTQKPEFKVRVLRSYGDVLRALGKLEESEKELQAIVNSENQQDRAETLISLGNTQQAIARQARDQREAKESTVPTECKRYEGDEVKLANAALDSYRKVETLGSGVTRSNLVQAQLNQISLLRELDLENKAEPLFLSIVEQLNQLPLARTKLYAELNLAQTLSCLNSSLKQEIKPVLTLALKHAETLQDSKAKSYAIGQLGHLDEADQDWLNAQKQTEKAILLAQAATAPEIAYKWQWQLGRILRNQPGQEKEAIMAYTEAIKSLDFVRKNLLASNSDIQFSFRDSAEPVYRELVDLLLSNQNLTELNEANFEQAIEVVDSLQVAELENFFRCVLSQLVKLDEVAKHEDKTAAIFYPIILENRLAVVAKLPNQPRPIAFSSPVPRQKLEDAIRDLRKALTNPKSGVDEYEQSAQDLYSWLIKPAEEQLTANKIKTLVFVLDGSLRDVPMAVLQKGDRFLIQDYAIATTPGLQLLGPKRLEKKQLRALVAGLISEGGVVTIKGRTLPKFNPLEFVKQEIEAVESALPNSVTLLKNEAFSAKNLQSQLQSTTFPIMHLATHGSYSPNPQETFILTTSNTYIDIEHLQELLKLGKRNRADAIEMLVLSACETAKGNKRAALGMAGIAVRAGAGSTMATLWTVDDESTAKLMGRFYQNLKQAIETRQTTKAEALRLAQVSLLEDAKSARFKHPYFWSPFILIGNWL